MTRIDNNQVLFAYDSKKTKGICEKFSMAPKGDTSMELYSGRLIFNKDEKEFEYNYEDIKSIKYLKVKSSKRLVIIGVVDNTFYLTLSKKEFGEFMKFLEQLETYSFTVNYEDIPMALISAFLITSLAFGTFMGYIALTNYLVILIGIIGLYITHSLSSRVDL